MGETKVKDVARIALKPGMILGQDVLNYRGELLFSAGTKIDETIIAKLARHSITAVTILEDSDLATTHFEKVRLSDAFKCFEAAYNRFLMKYKHAMSNFVDCQKAVDMQFLLDMHYELAYLAGSGPMLLDYLYNMIPNEDELTHTHCLNSALIAGVFADWLAMRRPEKDILILCAFFYDIGKLKLPYDLLWKSAKLSDAEYETIKTHPVLGHEIARIHQLDIHIANSILMHHERCDGTGYPAGLAKDQIDIYARHIAIIDAYEAMTSPRTYRQSMTPLQVISRFEQEGFQKYDETLLRPILKRIADSQIGLSVKLSDDSEWDIFVINPSRLSRPILKRNGTEFLDLNSRPDLEVVSIH